ncbi:MAG: hypothetical protein E7232_08530 [Lachnospiraceae bacterium]|jgi:type I site-specific restriction endonuclease|nr:hypothetical protein [Lachnospiraceae bacterium]
MTARKPADYVLYDNTHKPLAVNVDKKIAGRYYQEAAIKAVCDSFDKKNRRKALLVMATGSGSHDIYSHRTGSSRKSLYKIIMHKSGR